MRVQANCSPEFTAAKKSTVLLLSCLQEHPLFYRSVSLRQKKSNLQERPLLLLSRLEPSYDFLCADLVLHLFFQRLRLLDDSDYRLLTDIFFDGNNANVLVALEIIYLQNAVSYPELEKRKDLFDQRSAIVEELDRSAFEELDRSDFEELDRSDFEENLSAEAFDCKEEETVSATPACTIEETVFECSAQKKAFPKKRSRLPLYLLMSIAGIFVLGIGFSLLGSMGNQSPAPRSIGSDMESEAKASPAITTDPPKTSTENPDKTESAGSKNGMVFSNKTNSDLSGVSSADWFSWSVWTGFFNEHARELIMAILSGIGILITSVFLGIKEVIQKTVVSLVNWLKRLAFAIPIFLWDSFLRRTYCHIIESKLGLIGFLWISYIGFFTKDLRKSLSRFIEILSVELDELEKTREFDFSARTELVGESKKAVRKLMKELPKLGSGEKGFYQWNTASILFPSGSRTKAQ